MTAKSTSDFQLSGAYRLVAALFAIAVLTGCKLNIGGGLGGGCLVCGIPAEANLQGTLTGLVGSRLQVGNSGGEGGVPLNGAASNGASVVFTSVPFNTA